jgi:vancomycin resistance protein YoaR
MGTYTITRRRRAIPAQAPAWLQSLIALAGGVALFILISMVILLVFSIYRAGQIYPGVSMAGIDLSNLTTAQAADRLSGRLAYPWNGRIVFQGAGQTWTASPEALGLSLDPQSNAQVAYLFGREGNPFARLFNQSAAWFGGVDLAPALVYDERQAQQFLDQIAAQVDRPTLDATLRIDGVQVVAVPGQVGRKLDIQASIGQIQDQMRTLTDGVVPLAIRETQPAIMDTSQQAEAAQKILSQPLTLSLPEMKDGDPGPWKISSEQLARMLTIQRAQSSAGAQYQVALSEQALYDYLNGLAGDINRDPANARFTFNDDTRKLDLIKPAVIGRTLEVYSTIKAVNQKIAQGEHSVNLTLVTNQPDVADNATGEQLGISELLISYTSYFRGSSTERLQNIETAAANFHGLLVPPGATFSMASVMGNVSLDTGYAEALIIYGGRTIKGVGGGVCQVSTTLFRTAFMAGFPIVERHPHAYRVSYYEQTATGTDDKWAGLDATVFVPMVDFKFVNDSPYWLLMETYFHPNSRSLTWKFYSTSDGRKVEWESSGPQNTVDPPDPVYEENPDLAQGEIKQVDWAAEGADVTVTRTVYKDGQVWFSDSFITSYQPWADVFQYGPGTNLPKIIKKKKPSH